MAISVPVVCRLATSRGMKGFTTLSVEVCFVYPCVRHRARVRDPEGMTSAYNLVEWYFTLTLGSLPKGPRTEDLIPIPWNY